MSLPPVVENYLRNRGLVAVEETRLRELEKRPEHSCPFPLYPGKFGPHHDEYLGTILETEEPLSGLNVLRCSACGHVSFREPVAFA